MKIVFKQLPVLGQSSVAAAVATQCAAQQNAFWKYHDRLFAEPPAGQGGWSLEQYQQIAADLGLDQRQYQTCLESDAVLQTIQRDLNEAQQLGVRSTPSFLLNGELFAGALPYEVFEQKIEAALDETT